MRISNLVGNIMERMAVVAMATFAGACTVSTTGLGPTTDAAGTAGTSGTAICPTGLTDHATWPAGTTYTSCTKPCGPDDIGFRNCAQTDWATCQAAGGCVCLQDPGAMCVACASCAPITISNCYVPTNTAAIPDCPQNISASGACSPACGRQVCLEADGKTGCVCNAQGKYACAAWGETTWK
jgi:hypothetical protein